MWIIGNLMQLAKAWWTNYLQPSSWTLNKPLNKLLTRQNRCSKNFAGNIKAKNTLAKLQENKLNGNVITDGVSLCIWRQKNLSQVLYFTELCFTLHEETAFSTIPEHSLPNCKLYSNRCRQHASVSSGMKNSCCRRQDNPFWKKTATVRKNFEQPPSFFSKTVFPRYYLSNIIALLCETPVLPSYKHWSI